MFKLDQLQACQGQLDTQREQRSERGRQSLSEGLKLLDDYHRQPGKEVLLKAMYKFIECMSLQRDAIDPLILLSYIYYALKSHQLAIKYFRLAAALDPQAPGVLRMQAVLSQQEPIVTIAEARAYQFPDPDGLHDPSALTAPALNQDLNLDQLYDELSLLIEEALKQAMNTPLPQPPVLEPEQLEHLRQDLLKLEQRVQAHQGQLELLDSELNVQHLLHKMSPLETRLRQYRHLIGHSERGISLLDRTAELDMALEREWQRQPLGDDLLEEILDGCDQLADEIDALEALRVSITELAQPYRRLIQRVMAFQDALEDI